MQRTKVVLSLLNCGRECIVTILTDCCLQCSLLYCYLPCSKSFVWHHHSIFQRVVLAPRPLQYYPQGLLVQLKVFLCIYLLQLCAADELSSLWVRVMEEYLHHPFFFSLPKNKQTRDNEKLEKKNIKVKWPIVQLEIIIYLLKWIVCQSNTSIKPEFHVDVQIALIYFGSFEIISCETLGALLQIKTFSGKNSLPIIGT